MASQMNHEESKNEPQSPAKFGQLAEFLPLLGGLANNNN